MLAEYRDMKKTYLRPRIGLAHSRSAALLFYLFQSLQIAQNNGIVRREILQQCIDQFGLLATRYQTEQSPGALLPAIDKIGFKQ